MVVIQLFAVLAPAAHVPIPKKHNKQQNFLNISHKSFFFANILISYNIDFDLIFNIHIDSLYICSNDQQKKILFSPILFSYVKM